MAARGADRNCLFIRGFSKTTSETDIRSFFTKNVGRCHVESFKVYFNGWSSDLKLRFQDGIHAAKVRKVYHHKMVLGCRLTIEWFRPRNFTHFQSSFRNDKPHLKKYQLAVGRSIRNSMRMKPSARNRKPRGCRKKTNLKSSENVSESLKNSSENKKASIRSDRENSLQASSGWNGGFSTEDRKTLLPTPETGTLRSPNGITRPANTDWFGSGPRGRLDRWSPGRGRGSHNHCFDSSAGYGRNRFTSPHDNGRRWSSSRSPSTSRKRSLSPVSSPEKSDRRSSLSSHRRAGDDDSTSSSSSPLRCGRSSSSPRPTEKKRKLLRPSSSNSIPAKSGLNEPSWLTDDSLERPVVGQFSHAVRPSRGRGEFGRRGGLVRGLPRGPRSGKSYVFKSKGGQLYNGNISFGRGSPGYRWKREIPETCVQYIPTTATTAQHVSTSQDQGQYDDQINGANVGSNNITLVPGPYTPVVSKTAQTEGKDIKDGSSKITTTVERLLKASKRSLNLAKQRLAENRSRELTKSPLSRDPNGSDEILTPAAGQQDLNTNNSDHRSLSLLVKSTLPADVVVKVEAVDPDTVLPCYRENNNVDVQIKQEVCLATNSYMYADNCGTANSEFIPKGDNSCPENLYIVPNKSRDTFSSLVSATDTPSCQSEQSCASGHCNIPPSVIVPISADTYGIKTEAASDHSDAMREDVPMFRKRKLSEEETLHCSSVGMGVAHTRMQKPAKLLNIGNGSADETHEKGEDPNPSNTVDVPTCSEHPSTGSLEKIRAKKTEVETAFKQDCETFCSVVKMLISKDPSLEERIQPCLQSCLQDISEAFLSELKQFVADENHQE